MKIVAVVSGGLDSCAYVARYLEQGHDVHILTYNYSQKAQREIEVVKELFSEKAEIKILDISFMKDLWPNTQLTDDKVKVEDGYTSTEVVPNRNTIFLTIAVAYAQSINADRVILGSHKDDTVIINNDFAFPDCDSRFFELLETTLHIGHFKESKKVEIWSPSREGLGKNYLVRMGYQKLGNDIFKTFSCYKKGEKNCGVCTSCRGRRKAFAEAGITDLTEYEA